METPSLKAAPDFSCDYHRRMTCSTTVACRWLGAAALLGVLLLLGPMARAQPADPTSVWLDGGGRPNASAIDALHLLADAPADALVAEDYQAGALASQAAALQRTAPADGPQAQAFARLLDASMQRFVRDLHSGRIDPRSLGFRIKARGGATMDFGAVLHDAAARQQLPQAVLALRPTLAQYGLLRKALARYRAMASRASFGPLPTIAPARSLQPGAAYVGAAELQRRLIMLGDQPADAPAPQNQYSMALADAVKHFQARHGLDADGVLGPATLAALDVPLDQRVRQIALALERLRWLPDLGKQRFIGIN
ncbi:MAG: peptidoglycan-binding protein, partial [Rhodoferax sp.]